jgi:hypothetical protein
MRVYRYVSLRKIAAYLAAGWIPTESLNDCHHGRHAILMRACACFKGGADA